MIRLALPEDAPLFFEHLKRHMMESGQEGELTFHPMLDHASWKAEDSVPRMQDRWLRPVTEVGWERVWVLEDSHGSFVGHSDLRSGRMVTSLHRASFGMGVEKLARAKGDGKNLLNTAILWASEALSLDWIDLGVFSHNLVARRLYENAGFQQCGQIEDFFRVNGQSINDIQMVLRLRP